MYDFKEPEENPMTAEEWLATQEERRKERQRDEENAKKLVIKKIAKFLREDFGGYAVFTRETLLNKFGTGYFKGVEEIFKGLGFETKFIPGKVTGNLWWKTETEDALVISVQEEEG